MMLLTYQRRMLRAKVNTWLGSLLIASVALWAGLLMWEAATGENALIQAFSKATEQRMHVEDL